MPIELMTYDEWARKQSFGDAPVLMRLTAYNDYAMAAVRAKHLERDILDMRAKEADCAPEA